MPTIPENEFQDEELEQKVHDFITKKLEEIHLAEAHLLGKTNAIEEILVGSLKDILHLESSIDDQQEYNLIQQLQKEAQGLLRDYPSNKFLVEVYSILLTKRGLCCKL